MKILDIVLAGKCYFSITSMKSDRTLDYVISTNKYRKRWYVYSLHQNIKTKIGYLYHKPYEWELWFKHSSFLDKSNVKCRAFIYFINAVICCVDMTDKIKITYHQRCVVCGKKIKNIKSENPYLVGTNCKNKNIINE